MVDVQSEPKPADESCPPDRTPAPRDVPTEMIGKFNVHLLLAGIDPEMKALIESKIKSLPSVEYVETIHYASGELKLGIRLKENLEGFVDEFQKIEGLPVDFLGTTTLIFGRVKPKSGLAVEILIPKDGATVSTSKVWVGVEVKKGTPESVVINGVNAVAMRGRNRYKALVQCRAGSNEIVAVVKSEAGDVAEARIKITVNGDEAPAEEEGRVVVVQGKIDDPMGSVMVDGKEVKVDDNGNYYVKVKVANGTKLITVVETDSLGNKTVRKIAVE